MRSAEQGEREGRRAVVHLLPSGCDVLDVRSVRPTERVRKKKRRRKKREGEACSREGDLEMQCLVGALASLAVPLKTPERHKSRASTFYTKTESIKDSAW